MKNSLLWQEVVSVAGWRAVSISLALVVLGFGAVTTLPAQAQTYTESILHSFTTGSDGEDPRSNLIMDAKGNLYGTTYYSGTSDVGTVFKVDPTTREETILHTFTGTPDGMYPLAGLIFDAKGNLYGTTAYGGAYGYGTVFKLNEKDHETVLYSFPGGAHGVTPYAGLIFDAQGNLYGTTAFGGVGAGTVFKLSPPTKKGDKWTQTVLHSFTGGAADGAVPLAGLIFDAQGNLYGTTAYGGGTPNFGYGTVFKVNKNGHETVLCSFPGGLDSALPSGLIMDAKGNLYGTTANGGGYGYGTVFTLNKKGDGCGFLYSFSGPDGANPFAGVVFDAKGNLYGTTAYGGTSGDGAVFKVNSSSGTETVLYSFVVVTDSATPLAGLIFDAKGNLYGTTTGGGTAGAGTVFELIPDK